MRLTKKKAIDIADEEWTWLKKTGAKYKGDWLGWKEYGKMLVCCPLCEYDHQRGGGVTCGFCPYFKVFGVCYEKGTPFLKWRLSETTYSRKKYASQFLEQLKSLKEVK